MLLADTTHVNGFLPHPLRHFEPVRPTGGRTGTGMRETCLPGMKPALKRILLVEDDPQVREFGILALRGVGYELLPAESASQAQRRTSRSSRSTGSPTT